MIDAFSEQKLQKKWIMLVTAYQKRQVDKGTVSLLQILALARRR